MKQKQENVSHLPLAGVKVLDLTQYEKGKSLEPARISVNFHVDGGASLLK